MNSICAQLKNISDATTETPDAMIQNFLPLRKLLSVESDNDTFPYTTASLLDLDLGVVLNDTIDIDEVDDFMFRNDSTPVDKIKKFMSRHYGEFHLYSEVYVMTAVACFGLIFNSITILTIARGDVTPRASRAFQIVYIIADQLFLGLTLIFIQLRKYLPKIHYQLDMMNVFTACLLLLQCVQPWLLYALASHARAKVKLLRGVHLRQMSTVQNLTLALPPLVGYCALYLPWVRVLLYEHLPRGSYSLCNVPMENHWNLETKDVPLNDIFYILVYCLAYIVIVFVVPFFVVASRSKFIIDSLQAIQKRPELLEKGASTAYMALTVSVTCNVYLVCVTIKMALLSFYIFDFRLGYIVDASVFFQYLNVVGNLLLVAKSSVHFFIHAFYSVEARYILTTDGYWMWRAARAAVVGERGVFGKKLDAKAGTAV